MRAGLVGIFCFVALLALGHYVAAPFFCRGGLAIPTLDSRVFCGADLHLNRSGSMLLYFGSIAIAFLFGAIAGALSLKRKAETQPEAKSADNASETFEQILAAEEKKQAGAAKAAESPAGKASATASAVAAPSKGADVASAEKSKTSAAVTQASGASDKTEPAQQDTKAAETELKKSGDAAKVEAAQGAVATADAITVGLSAAKNGIRGTFDGTNEDLIARFRELKKQEGVNSIAQAQRLLDESTLAALAKGVDPKQHLSEVAHLVLAEDPDLQSGVVRGVVVHIAARLKELGVANKLPNPAKGAA